MTLKRQVTLDDLTPEACRELGVTTPDMLRDIRLKNLEKAREARRLKTRARRERAPRETRPEPPRQHDPDLLQGVRLLTVDDIAALLSLERSSVYRLIRSGQLPALNIGGRGRPTYRVERKIFQAFLEECRIVDIDGAYAPEDLERLQTRRLALIAKASPDSAE